MVPPSEHTHKHKPQWWADYLVYDTAGHLAYQHDCVEAGYYGCICITDGWIGFCNDPIHGPGRVLYMCNGIMVVFLTMPPLACTGECPCAS